MAALTVERLPPGRVTTAVKTRFRNIPFRFVPCRATARKY